MIAKENYIGAVVAALLTGIIGTWAVMSVQRSENTQTVAHSSSDVLKGLKGVRVLVEELPEGLKKIALKDTDITAEVEFALRRNGVRVFTKEEAADEKGVALLYLNLNCMGEVYSLSVECMETVFLERNPGTTACNATVWDASVMAYHVDNPEHVSKLINKYIDNFSNEFLKANPK